jgi:hypothetical protein
MPVNETHGNGDASQRLSEVLARVVTTIERSAPVAPIPATPAGYLVADVGALGVLLTQDGEAATATGVPTTPRLIPLFDAQRDDSPPIECARTGQPIRIADIRAARPRGGPRPGSVPCTRCRCARTTRWWGRSPCFTPPRGS